MSSSKNADLITFPNNSINNKTIKITSVSLSPDGSRIVSGGDNNNLYLWDTASGTLIRTFENTQKNQSGKNKVNIVSWSSDGKSIASGSDDNSLRIWDPESGKCVKTFEDARLNISNMPDNVISLAWNPQNPKLIAYGNSNSYYNIIIDIEKDSEIGFSDHTGSVNSISWSPDGNRIATGSSDKTIIINDILYNNKSYKISVNIRKTIEHPGIVTSVSWSPNSRYIVSGCSDGNLRIWDGVKFKLPSKENPFINPIECLMEIIGNKTHINSISWSYNFPYIISGGSDKILRIWKISIKNNSSECIAEFSEHKHSILDLSSNNLKNNNLQNRKIVSCDSNSIRIWDISNFENIGQKYKILRIPNLSGIEKTSWSPNGSKIVKCGDNNNLFIYDSKSGLLLFKTIENTIPTNTKIKLISWSPGGKYIACGSSNNLIIYNEDGSIKEKSLEHEKDITSLSWVSWNENIIASGCSDGCIYIWNIEEREPIFKSKKHTRKINELSWDPDGYVLASCSDDNKLIIWKMSELNNSNQPFCIEINYPNSVLSLSWDPSGLFIITSCLDGSIYLISLINGEIIQKVSLSNKLIIINSISWNMRYPNYIALGCDDGIIRILDFEYVYSNSDQNLIKSGILGETCIGEFKETKNSIRMVLWNSEGYRIMLCDINTIFIIDALDVSEKNSINNQKNSKSGGFQKYFNSKSKLKNKSKKLIDTFKKSDLVKIAKEHEVSLKNKDKTLKTKPQLFNSLKRKKLI